jgi:transmembrane sensor
VSNSSLPKPLLSLFEKREPEARLASLWRQIEARRRRRAIARPAQTVLAALAACVFIVSVGLPRAREWQRPSPSPLLTVERVVEPGNSPRTLNFGGGAQVTVGAEARLEVLEQTERSVSLFLQRGLAQFDIRPGVVRRWQIKSGEVTVLVVGTQFSVERSPSTVRVEVQRGRVLVSSPRLAGESLALEAGRVLVVETQNAPETTPPLAAPPESAAPESAPPESAAPEAAPRVPGAAASKLDDTKRSWREAAAARDWARAWGHLGADGLAQQSQRADSATDLFTLADVARRSGHPEAAVGPLRRIVTQYAQDPRAAVAAFTLGRLWQGSLGRPNEAATAFRDALSLPLPASLVEDAQAYLVQALAQSGREAEARSAAETYRRRFPNGAFRVDVDQWSAP